MTTDIGYDLRHEGRRVMQQLEDGPNPVVEARQMMSQTILAHVLLGLSDAGFYEYVAGRDEFSMDKAIDSLDLDAFTFTALVEYLLGCGALVRRGDDVFGVTAKGERLFNVYTRGVLNVYLGGYQTVLKSLGEVLTTRLPLNDPALARSTRHAAAGTAYSTCAFTLPEVFAVMRGRGGRICLDLGCGTGDFLLQWVLQDPDARGVGVDMSAAALAQARDSAARWGVADRLEFHEARVGPEPLAVPPGALDQVDVVSSMYMLHELGRDGRRAIVDVVRSLRAQLPGRQLLVLEVESCEPDDFAALSPPPPHLGRLDYRLIHQLSGQGLPRTRADWHGIFDEAGCAVVEPGTPTGGSLIYVVDM
ncbi:class I SAM-dependent methyltransferase [Solwaraspora sp. WMMD406]|uniref:class I SAM-dependent methyltransferase n=1 Tax=Solwaraspora sp. WMMD406 TaxID=3016095 RepID=UPI002417B1B8|nr:class I SAM-dependent methyltransferase [Solwaraspora sp. WMMD406]MDG4763208.1 class I SAM-dependent methyltransferase [Solwaraspora sp. WMMD406]